MLRFSIICCVCGRTWQLGRCDGGDVWPEMRALRSGPLCFWHSRTSSRHASDMKIAACRSSDFGSLPFLFFEFVGPHRTSRPSCDAQPRRWHRCRREPCGGAVSRSFAGGCCSFIGCFCPISLVPARDYQRNVCRQCLDADFMRLASRSANCHLPPPKKGPCFAPFRGRKQRRLTVMSSTE